MRPDPRLRTDLLRARQADDVLDGLVGGHLAARAMQRRVLMVGSVLGLAGIAVLIAVLIQNAPAVVVLH